jgi:hypothetical protein
MGIFGNRKSLEEKQSELRKARLKNRLLNVKDQRKKAESIIDSKLKAEKKKAFYESKKGKALSALKKGSVYAGKGILKGVSEYRTYQKKKQKKESSTYKKKKKVDQGYISPLLR